jgi:alkanesulfonate monooxygenase SsuD/methylene tetrahydromethanopterin reductase-like flavin-dependent oxidoreductase (luciferase family)
MPYRAARDQTPSLTPYRYSRHAHRRHDRTARGALHVGSPETVARKIAANLRVLGATRFDLKYGMPGMTHDQLITNIELYGRQVIPRVRELLG